MLVSVLMCARKICAYPKAVHHAQHLTRSSELRSSYDYIIIGGGTAGLTVADRLSESSECLWSLL